MKKFPSEREHRKHEIVFGERGHPLNNSAAGVPITPPK